MKNLLFIFLLLSVIFTMCYYAHMNDRAALECAAHYEQCEAAHLEMLKTGVL